MTDGNLIPVTTIGGYLGSGKTTLVNHLLRNAGGRRLAVLVNEFGELSIDEDLIEAEDDSLISIAGGCICCSFGDDLMSALQELQQMQPQPDHIIIESSGVALPGAIVATMSLLQGFQSDGTVVVTDAETIQGAASNEYIGDTIERQLSDAEIILLNKRDLVDDDRLSQISRWLDDKAPGAVQIPASYSTLPPEALFGVIENPKQGAKSQHSDALFESLKLIPGEVEDVPALAKALAADKYGVIRTKGYVKDTQGSTWLIQNVGKRSQAAKVKVAVKPGIVCIGLRNACDLNRLASDYDV